VSRKDQPLLIWDVLWALSQGFLKNFLMVLAVHLGHQSFYFLVPHLEPMISEYANSTRVSLSDIAESVWLAGHKYAWCAVAANLMNVGGTLNCPARKQILFLISVLFCSLEEFLAGLPVL
jgi:hypothetical protein